MTTIGSCSCTLKRRSYGRILGLPLYSLKLRVVPLNMSYLAAGITRLNLKITLPQMITPIITTARVWPKRLSYTLLGLGATCSKPIYWLEPLFTWRPGPRCTCWRLSIAPKLLFRPPISLITTLVLTIILICWPSSLSFTLFSPYSASLFFWSSTYYI